jgi:chromosome segregation ATPase
VNNLMIRGPCAVHLSPRMNFITGRNGTGKSRTVVAVQLALGSRSNDTGRGSTLSDFICKEDGIEEACIEVTLYNKGKGAFRPEVFGSYFTVVRKLTRSPDRIKPASSKLSIFYTAPKNSKQLLLFQAKPKEISALRDNFLKVVNVKPDNPMMILTQEEAKTMLDSNSREGLYKIFLQATNLDKLGGELDAMEKDLQTNAERQADLANRIQALEKDKSELQKRAAKGGDLLKLDKDILKVEHQANVRHLQDNQQKLERDRHALEKSEKRIQAFEAKIEKLDSKAATFDEPLQQKRQEKNNLELQHARAKQDADDAVKVMSVKLRSAFQATKEELRNVSAEEAAALKRVQVAKQKLAAERQKVQQQNRRASGSSASSMTLDEVEARKEDVAKQRELVEAEDQELTDQDNKLHKLREEISAGEKAAAAAVQKRKKQLNQAEQQLAHSNGSNDPFYQVKQEIARFVPR